MNITKQLDEELYYKVKLIREVEEAVRVLYPTDKIKSPVHLSIGHEAIAAGVCQNLQDTDQVFGYYRSHALYLAKGGDLNSMFAELYGKQTGCAHGWGGSMHLVDTSVGVNSTTAIVASSIPNAVGYAYAAKLRKTGQIVVSFFGDGATEEGVFMESLNFAALHKLPILFVCENNSLAIHTKQMQRQAVPKISNRAMASGVPTWMDPGHDPESVYMTTQTVLNQVIRAGNGPAMIEFLTCRWLEHVGPGEDYNLGYRTPLEVDPWKEEDSIRLASERLDYATRKRIDDEIETKIKDAVAFAEQSAFPEVKELMNYVYR